MTTSNETELVVVSGASTGMGAATARELASRGFHVLAGVRRESDADALRADGIEPVILDITNEEHVAALAARVAPDSEGRRLRILINNAGISINAPVETLSLANWRLQFEVNLFGHIAVTQALLPSLRANGGRIVNISSVGGKIAMSAYGAYAGAKFALEAMSDALRRELAHLGVQVVVVEPGAVQTEMAGRGIKAAQEFTDAMTPDQRAIYGDLMTAVINQASTFTAHGVPAEEAALVIAEAATTATPQTRYTIGEEAAAMAKMSRTLSDEQLDAALAQNLAPFFPQQDAS
ncbi:SDR family oxidoreductase [Dactylosporangium sp. CA-092794]|uniref:SDR family oxidoreductase n=1 Tax=Dactylosporangium sp. CA-092794 TaxID=3239929 RepID=UPI003D92FB38